MLCSCIHLRTCVYLASEPKSRLRLVCGCIECAEKLVQVEDLMLLLVPALLPLAIVSTAVDVTCTTPDMLLHWYKPVCSDHMASHKAQTMPHYQKQSS